MSKSATQKTFIRNLCDPHLRLNAFKPVALKELSQENRDHFIAQLYNDKIAEQLPEDPNNQEAKEAFFSQTKIVLNMLASYVDDDPEAFDNYQYIIHENLEHPSYAGNDYQNSIRPLQSFKAALENIVFLLKDEDTKKKEKISKDISSQIGKCFPGAALRVHLEEGNLRSQPSYDFELAKMRENIISQLAEEFISYYHINDECAPHVHLQFYHIAEIYGLGLPVKEEVNEFWDKYSKVSPVLEADMHWAIMSFFSMYHQEEIKKNIDIFIMDPVRKTELEQYAKYLQDAVPPLHLHQKDPQTAKVSFESLPHAFPMNYDMFLSFIKCDELEPESDDKEAQGKVIFKKDFLELYKEHIEKEYIDCDKAVFLPLTERVDSDLPSLEDMQEQFLASKHALRAKETDKPNLALHLVHSARQLYLRIPSSLMRHKLLTEVSELNEILSTSKKDHICATDLMALTRFNMVELEEGSNEHYQNMNHTRQCLTMAINIQPDFTEGDRFVKCLYEAVNFAMRNKKEEFLNALEAFPTTPDLTSLQQKSAFEMIGEIALVLKARLWYQAKQPFEEKIAPALTLCRQNKDIDQSPMLLYASAMMILATWEGKRKAVDETYLPMILPISLKNHKTDLCTALRLIEDIEYLRDQRFPAANAVLAKHSLDLLPENEPCYDKQRLMILVNTALGAIECCTMSPIHRQAQGSISLPDLIGKIASITPLHEKNAEIAHRMMALVKSLHKTGIQENAAYIETLCPIARKLCPKEREDILFALALYESYALLDQQKYDQLSAQHFIELASLNQSKLDDALTIGERYSVFKPEIATQVQSFANLVAAQFSPADEALNYLFNAFDLHPSTTLKKEIIDSLVSLDDLGRLYLSSEKVSSILKIAHQAYNEHAYSPALQLCRLTMRHFHANEDEATLLYQHLWDATLLATKSTRAFFISSQDQQHELDALFEDVNDSFLALAQNGTYCDIEYVHQLVACIEEISQCENQLLNQTSLFFFMLRHVLDEHNNKIEFIQESLTPDVNNNPISINTLAKEIGRQVYAMNTLPQLFVPDLLKLFELYCETEEDHPIAISCGIAAIKAGIDDNIALAILCEIGGMNVKNTDLSSALEASYTGKNSMVKSRIENTASKLKPPVKEMEVENEVLPSPECLNTGDDASPESLADNIRTIN